jgi:hypothetical protein
MKNWHVLDEPIISIPVVMRDKGISVGKKRRMSFDYTSCVEGH